MINTWFTSDTHFGHKNILEYEKEHRPFASLEEMHEVMIERWNYVVKPKDKVYHLGDFAFGRKNISIAGKLNGRKILILGNHDVYPMAEYMPYFYRIYGVLYWKRCILTHVPVHSYSQYEHFISYGFQVPYFLNLHGHLHSNKIIKPVASSSMIIDDKDASITSVEDINYLNVSCEQNNLTPIHSDVIMQRLMEIEK